jgi:Kdo2-lipid IVA lauroyltransferase/acyltransferase
VAAPLLTRIRRELRSRAIAGALRLVSLIPLEPAVRIGAAGGALAFHLFGKTRRLALAHLALAFPEMAEAERRAIAHRMFVHLGMSAMEVTSIRSWDERLPEYMEVRGSEVIEAALARGKGIVFVTGHLGNWELMARRMSRQGLAICAVAKRGGDARLMGLIEAWRASGGVTTLWREDPGTARALLRVFKENKGLGILVDQDTSVQGVWVPFFGRPAYTPRAPGDLALRTGAPVIVGTSHRRGSRPGDGFVFEATEVPYDPKPADREAEVIRITASSQAVLEDAIRRYPADWVWMHERWKTRPEGVPEPSPEGTRGLSDAAPE